MFSAFVIPSRSPRQAGYFFVQEQQNGAPFVSTRSNVLFQAHALMQDMHDTYAIRVCAANNDVGAEDVGEMQRRQTKWVSFCLPCTNPVSKVAHHLGMGEQQLVAGVVIVRHAPILGACGTGIHRVRQKLGGMDLAGGNTRWRSWEQPATASNPSIQGRVAKQSGCPIVFVFVC